ncbi:MAG: serine/threonine-protein kinase, partial [Isosphaeraceae bacterium]
MAHRDDHRTARDLLLAMIALERGWVDGRRLREAFEAWKSSPERAMGEVLASQGAVDARGRVVLESLVDEHRSRDGAGEHPAEAPAVAAPMAETVAYQGPLRPRPVQVDGAISTSGDPGLLDRFQIVRRHARGGLGEVFVAVDPELERRVALKELRDHHAHDPMSQARFLLEARLTGRLEHPGIVPVYGLGRYPDGRPYYAMRFIEGETLGLAIERFHRGEDAPRDPARREIAFRRLLRSLIDACNAVAYAHSRGVIHRDLKPDNIMLGRFGETLVVDWGLAKMSADGLDPAADPSVGPAFPDDSPYMTRPGSA